jgi:hypothetical protein
LRQVEVAEQTEKADNKEDELAGDINANKRVILKVHPRKQETICVALEIVRLIYPGCLEL